MSEVTYPNVPITDENELHQCVLDAAYYDWQNNPDIKSYDNMLENTRNKYGEFAEFLVLFGKYNYQVCNGGHSQYWGNGYASVGGNGYFSDPNDCDLHDRLIKYSEEYLPKILNKKLYAEIIRILETPDWFDVDDEEYFYEIDEEYNEETEEYEEVENDVYNDNYGAFNWDNDSLDTEYYAVNDEILAAIDNYLKGLVK